MGKASETTSIVLYVIHDCALGISPVTSYSRVTNIIIDQKAYRNPQSVEWHNSTTGSCIEHS